MSTNRLPVPYQIETFPGSSARLPAVQLSRSGARQLKDDAMRNLAAPRRSPLFLVQMIANDDPDARKIIGRRDIADQREAAYGSALSARPSQHKTPVTRVIDIA